MGRDARSRLNSLSNFANRILTGRDGTSAIPPTPIIPTSITQTTETVWIISETFGTAAQIQSLLSAATLAAEIYKVYQAEQIKKELRGISEQIKIYNNLVAGGSAGPDGFAQHVLDFINMKVEAYMSDHREHRFFLYHPDTQWHGAFRRIRHAQGFSHNSFIGFSHDLFVVFRLMLSTRAALEETMGEDAKDVVFHLLIPAYCTIVIPRSFRIVDAIFPLTIDGEIAQGDCLVWLNFHFIPNGMLVNVGNLNDLPESTWKKEALIMATGVVGVWGIVPLATIAAELIFPPLGVVGFLAGAAASVLTTNKVEEVLCEAEPPALLG